MNTDELSALLQIIVDACVTLMARPDRLTDPDQAELARALCASARALQARDMLAHVPDGDGETFHSWRHDVVGPVSLFMNAADLLLTDSEHPLDAEQHAAAECVRAVAYRMAAIIETITAERAAG